MARGKLKIVRAFVHALTSVIFAMLALLGLAAIALHILGYSFYAVKTQSMGNIYPSGTLILVDNTSPGDVAVGDVISVVIEDDIILTHRTVKNDTENELIYTRGDMNESEDSTPSAYDNVLGKVVLGIPNIGNLALKLNGTNERIVIIIIICIFCTYILISLIVNIVDKLKSRRKSDECKD